MGNQPRVRTHLLLGRYECSYGTYHWEEPLPGVACALSVGADPASPALQFKGDPAFPNEDGLLVAWDGPLLLLAVADGHHGLDGSHAVLQRLAAWKAIPGDSDELARAAEGLTDPPWPEPAGTSLVVVRLDRSTGLGFGLSWGDSRVCTLGTAGVRFLTHGDENFLPPVEPAERFDLELTGGELLLLFTDGVSECHYRSPATSVGPDELVALARRPGAAVRRLAELALTGVRGFPGGQDNLAIVAVAG